eukprot:10765231-Karenia_brevis.AAC.1
MDKLTGESNQFRMWSFSFKVCLGQIDSRLAEEVSQILSREDKSRFPSDWDPAGDILVDKEI